MKRKVFFNIYKFIYIDCIYKIRFEGMVVIMFFYLGVKSCF